ncbi:MAG: hypothetical protein ACKVOO_08955 [Burkholderiaceae bacterium]
MNNAPTPCPRSLRSGALPAALLMLALGCSAGSLQAQTNASTTAPRPETDQAAPSPSGPRYERIVIEDGGSRVDELRVGGAVQRVTVQPKFDVPSYEIVQSNKITSRPTGRDGAPPTHQQRVWNVLGF